MIRSISFILALFSSLAIVAQQPGDLDSSFAVNGKLVLMEDTGTVAEIASLADGKMLLMVFDGSTTKILRRNYDGSPDTTFASSGVLTIPWIARRMLVDADERIYVIGNAIMDGIGQGVVQRFHPSGDLDLEYGSTGVVTMTFTDTINYSVWFKDAAIYPDGRLLVCGDNSGFTYLFQPASLRAVMFRLETSGAMDESFMDQGVAYFNGAQNYTSGPFGYPCTTYLYRALPMVRIGPQGEIYLIHHFETGGTCTPNAPDHGLGIRRYMSDSLISDDQWIFYSWSGYAARPTSVVSGNNGLISVTYISSIVHLTSTKCFWQGLNDCGLGLPSSYLVPPSNANLFYYGGTTDIHGHFLHLANARPMSTGLQARLAIHRTTTFDLSGDPDWGTNGFVFYDSAYVDRPTGIMIQADGKLLVGGVQKIDGIERPIVLRYHNIPDPRAKVQLKVFLGGPYDPSTQLMNDQLRIDGLIPLQDPYTASGFTSISSTYMHVIDPSVLETTGDSAVIDWVWLEALASDDPTQIIAARAALLLANGAVTDLDGRIIVNMNCGAGQYHLRVRHRNHLSVTTANPIALGIEPAVVDLTSPNTATFGTDAQMMIDGLMMMWPGDAKSDGIVKYIGAGNDRDRILVAIGGTTPTNVVAGYLNEDVNLDGSVKYVGASNDRDVILQSIGGSIPTAIRVQQSP